MDNPKPTTEPITATSVKQALKFAAEVGYPVKLQSNFSRGWQAVAVNEEDLTVAFLHGLSLSPTAEIVVSKEA
jgi:carbamoylphosphate synthase large subunit